jgi:hypothetical protein
MVEGAVPVIDLHGSIQVRDDQVAAMRSALLGGGSPCDGSFYVVGHGVDQAAVDELFAQVGWHPTVSDCQFRKIKPEIHRVDPESGSTLRLL